MCMCSLSVASNLSAEICARYIAASETVMCVYVCLFVSLMRLSRKRRRESFSRKLCIQCASLNSHSNMLPTHTRACTHSTIDFVQIFNRREHTHVHTHTHAPARSYTTDDRDILFFALAVWLHPLGSVASECTGGGVPSHQQDTVVRTCVCVCVSHMRAY